MSFAIEYLSPPSYYSLSFKEHIILHYTGQTNYGNLQPNSKTYIESTFNSSAAAKSLRQFSMPIYRINESPYSILEPAMILECKSKGTYIAPIYISKHKYLRAYERPKRYQVKDFSSHFDKNI